MSVSAAETGRPRHAGAVPMARRTRWTGLVPWAFLAPFLFLFVALQLLPLIYAFWLSLFRTRLVGGTAFVGIENYQRALMDDSFWRGVWNVVLFGVVQIPVMLAIALVLALILDSTLVRMRGFFRLLFYIPYAVPTVIAAIVWGYLYGPNYGPFTQIAGLLDIPPPQFLSEGALLWSIANIVTWEFVGYNMVILFAALQAVPRDLEEAAAIDGAGPIGFAWHTKLPLILPALLLCGLFSIIGTFQLFNEPRVLARLAPQVIRDDYTPAVYAYSLAFTNIQYNMAAAVSFLIAAFAALLSYIFIRLTARHGGPTS